MRTHLTRPMIALASAALLISATLVATLTAAPPAQAATGQRDGTRSDQAASSCWQIKQTNPNAANGRYWLQTPALVAPQQFYCDMVTDGGGWVLVGRGREGWSFATNGQGTPSELNSTVTGQAAFKPAALSSRTINGLLNNGHVNALPDGIRVKRANKADGSSYQEMRLHTSNVKGWSWAFGGGLMLRSVRVNSDTYSRAGDSTRDWRAYGTNDDYRRMVTFLWSKHRYLGGFSYGNQVPATHSDSTYLWEYGTENAALPFAQVWLRPKLGPLEYTAPPAAGAPARTLRPLMSNRTEATPWGVTGVVSGLTGENHIEVQAMAALGSTIYVGGEFEYVQRGPNPGAGEKIRQPYLAAFDINTGAWRSGFRPKLNGTVWDIQPNRDGTKLFISGEFSSVAGASRTRGLAAINPSTGAPLSSWKASLSYESLSWTKGRALDLEGDTLYVGGVFTSVNGGVATRRSATVRNLTRLRASDGLPDIRWHPRFSREVIEIDATPRSRVYAVGRFQKSSANPSYIQANGFAAVTTASPGSLVPGFKQYRPTTSNTARQYQQTVREVGESVWVGGSQHNLHKYNRSTFALQRSFLTYTGGDFQATAVINGTVYAACHCQHAAFSDTLNYDAGLPQAGASRVDPITWIGAWDERSGSILPDFAIAGLRSREGNGPWELTRDRNGCLWFGGDMRQGSWRNGRYQWLGGFGNVCPRDTRAPGAPSGLQASRDGGGVSLSWTGSAEAGVNYELIRNDRVIATVASTGYLDTTAPAGSSYWVRAIDAAGNRSATTPGRVG